MAQFGRGVLADVSAKLLDQFVDNLEATVLAERAAPRPATEPSPTPTPTTPSWPRRRPRPPSSGRRPAAGRRQPRSRTAERRRSRKIDQPEAEPIDLLDAAGAPVAKRLAGRCSSWSLRRCSSSGAVGAARR